MSDAATAMLTEETPTPENLAAANESRWYGDDHADIVEAKGWKAPDEALYAYRNLEKLVGANTVALPKGDDDVAAYDKIFNSLGRPQTPAEYKLEAEGMDPEALKGFTETAHKAGLTQKQVQEVMGFYKGLTDSVSTQATEEFQRKSSAEMDELQKEHGAAFSQFKTDAQKGARELGLSGDDLESLEFAVGTKKMMNMLARTGMYTREDTSTGETDAGMGLSPNAASKQINDLLIDPNFTQAWMDANHPGHKGAVEKMAYLHKMKAGG